jgi:hypothetical protein
MLLRYRPLLWKQKWQRRQRQRLCVSNGSRNDVIRRRAGVTLLLMIKLLLMITQQVLYLLLLLLLYLLPMLLQLHLLLILLHLLLILLHLLLIFLHLLLLLLQPPPVQSRQRFLLPDKILKLGSVWTALPAQFVTIKWAVTGVRLRHYLNCLISSRSATKSCAETWL